MKRFGIAPENVLGACAHFDAGLVTHRIHRVPSGPGKGGPRSRAKLLFRKLSSMILAMLEIAEYCLPSLPNPDLENVALNRGWKVYWPMGTGKLGYPLDR